MTPKEWVSTFVQQNDLARTRVRDLYQSCLVHCEINQANLSINLFSRLMVSKYGFRRVRLCQGMYMCVTLRDTVIDSDTLSA